VQIGTDLRMDAELFRADRTVFTWPLFLGNSPLWYNPKKWLCDDEGTITCDNNRRLEATADTDVLTADLDNSPDGVPDTADSGNASFSDAEVAPSVDETIWLWSHVPS
jgi:hypothetical protein